MNALAPQWLAALCPEADVLGDPALLAERPVAVVGSRRCPGALLLAAADWADAWATDASTRPTLAGGFQTPVETEVLRRLLRGGAPVVRLPARRLPRRLQPAERDALKAGSLALATPFTATRASTALAARRNGILARISRAAVVLYAAPASRTLAWVEETARAGLPLYTLDHPANASLLRLGARALTTGTTP